MTARSSLDTVPKILDRTLRTYDGPLSPASDMMVWNVTKEDIRVREIILEEHVWPPPPVDPRQVVFVSDLVKSGNLYVNDIIQLSMSGRTIFGEPT